MTNLILSGATAQPQTLAQALVFDVATGLQQNVVQMFWSMQQGNLQDGTPRYTGFPVAFANALYAKNQIYMQTWGTWDWVNKVNWGPDVALGKHDAYFHAQAKLIKAMGHSIFIRLNHEFNGAWAAWFTDGPSFVALWRHVVDIFRAEGATNVTWVWCPNGLAPAGSTATTAADKVAAYYPGDEYVDWTAFDAYNTGGIGKTWLTFSEMVSGNTPRVASWVGDTYGTIARLAPSKPMMMAEFGCHTVGGDKAAWIRDALAVIPMNYPLIRAINYYNVVDGVNLWPLLTTDGTAQAWAAGIKAGAYALSIMPPGGQVIRPLSTMWGDPAPDLSVQLAAAQGALDDSLTEITTQHDRANAAELATKEADAQFTDVQGHLQALSEVAHANPA